MPIYRIYIVPEETKDIEGLVQTVSENLNLREKTIKRIWAKIKKQPKFQPVLVSENTDWATLAKLQAKNLDGLHVESGFARVYELGPAGAHIFGYVGEPNKPVPKAPFFTTGITGLEKRYNDIMLCIQQFGYERFLYEILSLDNNKFFEQWKPNFDWFVDPNNFLKVTEGTYRFATKKEEVDKYSKEYWDSL